MQVMIYRELLGSHAESCSPQVAEDLFRMHRLDPKKELSKAVSSSSTLCMLFCHTVAWGQLCSEACQISNTSLLEAKHSCFMNITSWELTDSSSHIDQCAWLQVKEFARQHGIALVMNLAQVMSSLQETAAKLPPCREEMEVRLRFLAKQW